ncbi:acyltransferase family protein [Microvirga mediterraneensis]|uniref:Acyltransferase n=1 Tax=Microvirga mediterraneensis TaxID=2754695 RepID=A0A838BV84_9HYPH|nr:acyltransferase [Microvirga mediterraneensis]MBA1159341.1 acyltransferase [Microvirga mediterraneensis]
MKERLSYLDGLRGLAALIVVLHHGLIYAAPALYFGEARYSRFAWDVPLSGSPFLLFFAGNFAVSVFFLLSGFVLAHVFSRTVAGPAALVAKRYVRLTVPITAANLLSLVVTAAMIALPALAAYSLVRPGMAADASFLSNVIGGLAFCLREAFIHATLTGIDGGTYNGVLWTMQVEFIGSVLLIAVFTLARALTRTDEARLNLAAVICAVLALCWYQSNLALFPTGVLLYRLGRALPASRPIEIAGYGLLALGLYLGCMPESGLRPQIQNALLQFTGTDMVTLANHSVLRPIFKLFGANVWVPFPFLPVPLWRAWGAVLVLLAVLCSPSLRRALSSRACAFLGLISFPLYLVHGTVLQAVFVPVFEHFGRTTGAMLAALAAFVPAALLIAVVFTRLTEGRALRWSERAGRFFQVSGQATPRPSQRYRAA